jgi:gluconate 2-dehydrogenase gamma chain
MMARTPRNVSRRGFLGGTLALASALPFAPARAGAAPAAGFAASAAPVRRYRSLTAAEASFTEAMVNALCPADHLTPDGVTSGLAAAFDAQLAPGVDATVQGQRELFKAGLAAAEQACRARYGLSFDRLPPGDARQFLRDIAAGDVAAEFPLASWSSDVVEPLLKQVCFAGPIYDAHGTRIFWKLFG